MKHTLNFEPFYVVAYKDGKFVGAISGLGCNRGTLDASHSKSAAEKHAARMRVNPRWAGHEFRVEGMVQS